MRVQPLIAVADVEASSRWYCTLLGAQSGHGGPEYERVMHEGTLLLQIHTQEAPEHPSLGRPRTDSSGKPSGAGVLVWFEVDDFDAALERVEALGAPVVEGPLVNPNARHREIWLSDPDRYVVVLSSPDGETA